MITESDIFLECPLLGLPNDTRKRRWKKTGMTADRNLKVIPVRK